MSVQNPSIMIVEDEKLLLDAISKKLTISKIKPIPCDSAEAALEKLHEGKRPDAIWLDYHLKGMDGEAFVSKLLKDKSFADIPVIVVSNSAPDKKIEGMLKLGVKQYLLKAEHRMDDITNIIKTYIH